MEEDKAMSDPTIFNPDGSVDREMLDILSRKDFKESNDQEMERALELSAAGWQAELGSGHSKHPFDGQVSVMSWYWRRPPRRKGGKGRLFLSTGQAYNAMQRDRTP